MVSKYLACVFEPPLKKGNFYCSKVFDCSESAERWANKLQTENASCVAHISKLKTDSVFGLSSYEIIKTLKVKP